MTSDSKPAGGWAALNSSLKILRREGLIKGAKALCKVNQPDGFDCPGCAWPDPKNPSTAEFCENGVKAVTHETTKKRATRALFDTHTLSDLETRDHHWLESQGRLCEPLIYDAASDRYQPIPWEDAFTLIAQEFRALASPDEAIFYTSGRTSNEAAFLYQLLGRVFGTNNFPDCSNMCHESSGVAMGESVGIGKGTVLLEDFDHADAIFVVGQNPGTNHPRMLTELQKAARRGAKIVCFNPLKEKGLLAFTHPQEVGAMLTQRSTDLATHYYQPLVGGDMAAVRAMIKYLFEQDAEQGGVFDRAFIAEHCSGFEAYQGQVEAESESWEMLLSQCGLSKTEIIEAAEVYRQADRVICCWAMGLTQQKNSVITIQELINLLLLRGNIGREGAGACPVRGHSNVQGDRTVGITEKPTAAFLDSLGETFGFKAPYAPGFDAVAAIEAMHAGRGKIFIGMGGNFAAATPDTAFTEAALRKCRLTVHISTHLNRSHVVHGEQALILPCLGRTEQDVQSSGVQSVTVEDSMSMVHASTGSLPAASPALKSEPAIVAGIGQALFPDGPVSWETLIADYALIREKIQAVLPAFKNYNQQIKTPGGFHLKNSARDREWKTATEKARFMATPVPEVVLKPGRLRLMTLRSHDQYNTTIYAKDDRYRGVKNNRRVIFLHAEDLRSRGIEDGDLLTLTSFDSDEQTREAHGFQAIAYDIPIGCAGAYFPETNVLVGIKEKADRSRTPMSKFIQIELSKSPQA
ncbi:MAG: molybdopterin-dependent oxidoreductase alpha subunit [Candidatus Omnitrophota bacterium]|jgi:molybdopterin-dependent oxidoreductase alpha subunit